MSKRKARKAAYKAIVKEGKSHQECFNSLRKELKMDADELAEEVSRVPSLGKTQEFLTLRTVYLVVLGIVIVLRSLGIITLTQGKFDLPVLIAFLGIGVLVPGYGIYGALTRRIDSYRSMAVILGFGILRGVTKDLENLGPESLYFLIPFVAAIVLAIYIPTKLKTPFTKTVKQIKTSDGKTRNVYQYKFEDTRVSNEDILDDL